MNKIRLNNLFLVVFFAQAFMAVNYSWANEPQTLNKKAVLSIQHGHSPGPVPIPLPGIFTVTLHVSTPGTAGFIIIENNSYTTATNIAADLTGFDVTQNASQCASLNPGASCAIYFYPGASTYSPTSVSVRGTNTNTVTFLLQVIP